MRNITEWIHRLSIKHPTFGNLPACPYARNSIYKIFKDNPQSIIEDWDDSFEIAVVILSDISSDDLTRLAKDLSDDKFLVLEDHPDEIEQINGYNLNYGEPLLLITKRDKMVKARSQLFKTKYYDNFDSEYLEDLLTR